MLSMDSGFSLIAVGAALASFLLVFLTYQTAGLILGLVAIAVGGLGLLLAIRYRLSDRKQSVASILLGVGATVLALVVLIF